MEPSLTFFMKTVRQSTRLPPRSWDRSSGARAEVDELPVLPQPVAQVTGQDRLLPRSRDLPATRILRLVLLEIGVRGLAARDLDRTR